MPRRASSGIKVGQMVGIAAAIIGFFVIAAVLIFLIAGDLFSFGGGGGGSSRSAPLNVTSYLDNANSLRDNEYRVDGTVQEMLRWSENGRLISFNVNDGSLVPILVPGDIENVNLERGAEMSLEVVVGRDGTLRATAINN